MTISCLATVFEEQMRARGARVVVGVDEVGRGPLAGPVVAAAVVVPDDVRVRDFLLAEAGDSKVLKAGKRESLAAFIHQHCAVALGEASVEEVDAVNIRNATFVAMGRALGKLELEDAAVLVDGNALIPKLECLQQAIVKGDGKELAIACASIVAKVYRDALMVKLAEKFPHYGWERNAGYGTALHLEGLRVWGACEHHRRSFAPVKEIMDMTRDAAA